ncbi:MAG: DUF6084 family protein [Streptosporangiaceae bacterium]
MAELVFDCVDARAEHYAAAPTLVFRLRVAETTGTRVHAIALRCQLRIEPIRRRYDAEEAEGLLDLFGDRERFGETLKPLQFANVSTMVPGFAGSVETDLPVACTYDLDVAASKYFHALRDGEIPLLLLFSGTVFVEGGDGYRIEQVPWSKEARYRVPVGVWRELMDVSFPNTGWVRVHRDTLDALQRFKAQRAIPTWDDTFAMLLKQAEEVEP